MNARVKKQVPLDIIEQFYRIEDDGAVFSLRRNKYIKPSYNIAGYLYVGLRLPNQEQSMWAVHRLIACKFIGQCPDGLETSHKDGNKNNNHYSNLEYITHAENIFKSYREHGRIFPDYKHKPFSNLTKQLMSDAKKKQIRLLWNGQELFYSSIEEASQSLHTYRKKIYRCIKENIPFKDKNQPNFNPILSFAE